MALKSREWPEIGEKLVTETLPSGLTVAVMPKPGLKKTYATYATHYGSIDNRFRRPDTGAVVEVPDGIAHFLEHKMYEKPEGQDVFERFAELGAYTNAYTDYTSTTFLFSATAHLEACLDTLLRLVEEPYFTPENVEKEKGIIEQEIRMYWDMPGDRLHSQLMHALYQKNPVRLDIAGDVESIRRITPDDLYTCYHTFYHPSNMVIFVAGDVDPAEVIDFIGRKEAARHLSPTGPIERLYPDEPDAVKTAYVEREMPVATPLLLMGLKDLHTGLRGEALLRHDMTLSLLWSLLLGHGSPAFHELYEAGLINDRFSAHYSGATTFGVSSFGGETPYPELLADRLRKILVDAPLTPEALERVKRRELGEFIALFDNLEDLAYTFNALYFREIELGMIPRVLDQISLADLEKARRDHVREALSAISVIRPGQG